MGSRFSTIPEPSSESIRGAPHLPLDVLLEILSHLSPNRDRQTLVSTALCCSALRNASQRVLFKSMRLGREDYEETYQILHAHFGFLQAIVDSPDRLALFVRSYWQVELALTLNLYKSKQAPSTRNGKTRVLLWFKTLKALPLMTELKDFKFEPFGEDPSVTGLLDGCTFQLESFTWRERESKGRLIEGFLPRQPRLLHLDLGFQVNETPVPDHVCPNLVSIACNFPAFAQIAETRLITALRVELDSTRPVHLGPKSPYLAVLKRLKYLDVSVSSPSYPLITGMPLDNITVLEHSFWHISSVSKEMGPLSVQFPQLRVVHLSYTSPSSAYTNPSMRHKAATEAFGECPALKTVILSSTSENRLSWEFCKREGSDLEEEVIGVEVMDFTSSLWWKAYIV